MKIIITGGTGFVGANLVRYFLKKGDEVNILLRPKSNVQRLEGVLDYVRIYQCDSFEDLEKLADLCKIIAPDVVVHCAAYGTRPFRLGVPYQTNIDEMIRTNVIGTSNLMRACEGLDLDAFINIGSSSEYGIQDKAMCEVGPINPISIYGATKASATLLGEVMARQVNFPIYTLRLFAVYGKFEDPTRLIPTIISGAINNKMISLSSPHPVRDFVHVNDVAVAINVLIGSQALSGIYNLCTGKQWSIAEVVATVEEVLAEKLNIRYGDVALQPNEPQSWVGDPNKLKSIGWEPRTLTEGIKDLLYPDRFTRFN